MPQFFLSLPHDSEEEPTMATMDPAELEETMAKAGKFLSDLQEQGALLAAGGLQPPSTAKTVDGTGDSPVVNDGPFVEAAEYLGGFWVIEAEHEQAALEWAKQGALALGARIEVRALQ
ncbi:YciI family protein, partial [Actinomadura adrarensis]